MNQKLMLLCSFLVLCLVQQSNGGVVITGSIKGSANNAQAHIQSGAQHQPVTNAAEHANHVEQTSVSETTHEITSNTANEIPVPSIQLNKQEIVTTAAPAPLMTTVNEVNSNQINHSVQSNLEHTVYDHPSLVNASNEKIIKKESIHSVSSHVNNVENTSVHFLLAVINGMTPQERSTLRELILMQ